MFFMFQCYISRLSPPPAPPLPTHPISRFTSGGASIDAEDRLQSAIAASGLAIKAGKAVSLTGVSGCGFEVVSVVGLGEAEKLAGKEAIDENEEIEVIRENVRKAVAAGVKDVSAKP